LSLALTNNIQISKLLLADMQTIQLGTSEKVGLFLQPVSYFVTAFTVGFILNARLTGILFASVVPLTALVICFGTKAVSHVSRQSSQLAETATSIADGAIRAVTDVQAFGAEDTLARTHFVT
jgi:ATP-binding cassette, subfamily B (MDR/TAP), member 1